MYLLGIKLVMKVNSSLHSYIFHIKKNTFDHSKFLAYLRIVVATLQPYSYNYDIVFLRFVTYFLFTPESNPMHTLPSTPFALLPFIHT